MSATRGDVHRLSRGDDHDLVAENVLLRSRVNELGELAIPRAIGEPGRPREALLLHRCGRCRRAELRQQPEHGAVRGADVATSGSVLAANDEPVVGYADVLGLDDRPPGAVPGMFLCVGAREQLSAHLGVEAIGADEQVRVLGGPVGETDGHAVLVLLEAGDRRLEPDVVIADRLGQQVVKAGAVRQQVAMILLAELWRLE
jgi:hypothetical protein